MLLTEVKKIGEIAVVKELVKKNKIYFRLIILRYLRLSGDSE